ncbi:MAG: acyltransferase [Mesorhizobium sp.]|uniref:acyltransferase family protein n=1 Tax=unclassified Mesorhizobium TaxID=325217 RepID=UPI000FD36BD3|nr:MULTISPECIES: acyltransferase [unclassified Mesorhizobium]RVD41407.1 acyltransferase [Mesorhizobium sp. M4A.F.Ca.ET.020.02.1.1]RWC21778.1 MAG: acyltransferase [Mesorhizobium sp.]RWD04698.1 MAG: acyltransferase [Mesorhizobium sp.]RWD29155.1 MAG: acyltransferase [Mesorhizobium sp.]TIW22962.1 MAG: acyltransferase [Mesorhizobium sp.]
MTRSRVECLDGLRALAAMWVLVGHCLLLTGWRVPVLGEPDLGVDLFIMLSGFLMVFHYQLRQDREPWQSPETWLKFWTRRYFRIAPLFYVMLFLALALGPYLYESRTVIDDFLLRSHQAPERYLDSGLKNIVAHLLFLFGLLPNFAYRTPLPDWSLGLEMQFYAVFPAVMLLVRRLDWIRSAVLIAALGGLVVFAMGQMSVHFPMPSFLALKMQVFLCGMLLAGVLHQSRPRPILYLALAMLLGALPYGGEYGPGKLLMREVLVMGFFALVLYRILPGMAGVVAARIATTLGNRFFHLMGELSFSIYLIHLLVLQPVAAFVITQYGHDLVAPLRFAIVLLIVLPTVSLLSWITYNLIEIPGQKAGRFVVQRFGRKTMLETTPASAAAHDPAPGRR